MEMKRVALSNYDLSSLEQVPSSDGNRVFKLYDGSYLKIFDDNELIKLAKKGVFLDRKLEYAEEIQDTAIILPSCSVFNSNGITNGFILPGANGISCSEYLKKLRKCEVLDLVDLVDLYAAIEREVIRANIRECVFPDLLNINNTFVSFDRNLGKYVIEFIDYDGIQLGDNPSTRLCSKMNIGFVRSYRLDNSVCKDGLYTKKIDMVSLTYLYFYMLFNCNLDKLNFENNDNIYTLLFLYRYKILDKFLIDLVNNSIYPSFNADTIDYLGNKAYWIADNYRLDTVGINGDGTYERLLVKK